MKSRFEDSAGENPYWAGLYNKYLRDRSKGNLFCYQAICYEAHPPIFNKVFSFFDFFQLKKVLSQLKIETKGKKVIDIGCGTGRFSRFYSGRGASVTGIDITQEVIESNRRYLPGIRFETMSAFDIKLADREFDIVNAFIVVQHIPSSMKRKAIEEMSRVLKPGGRMIICEAFFNDDKNKIEGESSALCSERTLENMFADSGFDIIEKHYLHFYPLYGYYMRMKPKVYSLVKKAKPHFTRGEAKKPGIGPKNDPIQEDDGRQSLKHRIYKSIDLTIIRIIACLSFLIEFMYGLFPFRSRKGSHALYVLRKHR